MKSPPGTVLRMREKMADKPMIMTGHSVRALLEGRKTQTRRVLKPQPEPWRDFHLEGGCQIGDWKFETGLRTEDGKHHRFGLWMHSAFHESRFQLLPYAPGDRLWVKETFVIETSQEGGWLDPPFNDGRPIKVVNDQPEWGQFWCQPHYRATDPTPDLYSDDDPGEPVCRWTSPIFMPRWASRLTLIVTDVCVQRVQDISEADAQAEGVRRSHAGGPWGEEGLIEDYADLWNNINAKRGYGWDENPWVAALTFKVDPHNIDVLGD